MRCTNRSLFNRCKWQDRKSHFRELLNAKFSPSNLLTHNLCYTETWNDPELLGLLGYLLFTLGSSGIFSSDRIISESLQLNMRRLWKHINLMSDGCEFGQFIDPETPRYLVMLPGATQRDFAQRALSSVFHDNQLHDEYLENLSMGDWASY